MWKKGSKGKSGGGGIHMDPPPPSPLSGREGETERKTDDVCH